MVSSALKTAGLCDVAHRGLDGGQMRDDECTLGGGAMARISWICSEDGSTVRHR